VVDIERADPGSPLSPAELEAEALFEEARLRARRRRRRRAAALGGAILAIAVAGVAVLSSPRQNTPARNSGPVAVAPRTLLAGGPYMGVSCSRANSIACDRVGLAVWTRRPARAVRATVAGRPVTLDDPEWSGPSKHGLRRMFAGFLQPAGLLGDGPLAVRVEDRHYYGVHPVYATVRLVITYADGSQKATSLRVELSPGWG
jgi:hypothetical protein